MLGGRVGGREGGRGVGGGGGGGGGGKGGGGGGTQVLWPLFQAFSLFFTFFPALG